MVRPCPCQYWLFHTKGHGQNGIGFDPLTEVRDFLSALTEWTRTDLEVHYRDRQTDRAAPSAAKKLFLLWRLKMG